MLNEEEGLEEAIRYCGTPLKPYEEDSFPSRKKIAIEDQVVKDAQGRQRFHGAFTGGFSAGFFNTVGSLEGWNPREFKSSRQEKADELSQKPEDFMDEEDIGEFGFAPRRIKAKKEYAVKDLRKIEVESSGPIPGESVLKTILSNSRETIGDILIQNVNYSERIRKHQELASQMRMYGCVMPLLKEIPEYIESKEYKVPDLFKQNLEKPKSNTSGLGHLNLEGLHTAKAMPQKSFVVKDSNNKTLTIRGHAFGVGAFEQEDEDIYSREDMSNYDFELTKEKEVVNKNVSGDSSTLELDLFIPAMKSLMISDKHKHPLPVIDQRPGSSNRVRKSRFEPLKNETDHRNLKQSRHESLDSTISNKPKGGLDPIIRARYLGEHVPETSSQSHNSKDLCTPKDESDSSSNINFGVDFSDRFVSSTSSENVHDILQEVKPTETEHGTEQMRAAAKMKMFGDLTRQSIDWRPSPLLCKRFNIAEPLVNESGQLSASKRKPTREVIFYLEENKAEEVDINAEIVEVEVTQKKIKLEEVETVVIEDVADTTAENMDNPEIHEVKVEKDITMVQNKPLVDVVDKIGVEENRDMYKSVFCSSSESEGEDDTEETNANVSKNNLIKAMDLFSSETIKHPFGQVAAEVIPKDAGSDTPAEKLTITDSLNSSTKEISLNTPIYGPALPPKISDNNPRKSNENSSKHTLEPEDNGYEWIEKGRLKKSSKHQKKEKKRIKAAKRKRRAKS